VLLRRKKTIYAALKFVLCLRMAPFVYISKGHAFAQWELFLPISAINEQNTGQFLNAP